MSTSDSNCKDGASKSKSDGVCDVNDKLQNMSIGAAVSICANCGKEDANNVCNKCKQVRYCNAVCKKVHKKKHKKDCEELIRLATEKHNEELKIAAEYATKLHEEKLFQQPQPADDCPICFLRIPSLQTVLQTGARYTGSRYYECCGKVICSGCCWAPLYDNQGNEVDNKKCPYCRTPETRLEKEIVKRLKKRVEANDPLAIHDTGCWYKNGINGYPQDYSKALELWHRAGELGFAKSYTNIGYAYRYGEGGVGVDEKKAIHYYELAAMKGEAQARHNLGLAEERAGNFDRAVRHFMIALRDGKSDSLKEIKKYYSHGHASKEVYTKALRLYQEYLGEIKSPQRDRAAAAHDECKYYETG